MKPRALFRILIKLLAVLLFVTALSELASSALNLVALYQATYFNGNNRWLSYAAQFSRPMIEIAAALYLFFDGEWIVQRAVPDSRRRCPECEYDLSHASGIACPECGTPVGEAGPQVNS